MGRASLRGPQTTASRPRPPVRRQASGLRSSGVAPRAGRQTRHGPVADAPPDQPQRGVVDRGGHAADLAVAAFADRYLQPAIGDARADPDRRHARPEVGGGDPLDVGAGRAILQQDAAPQPIERVLAGIALDLHEIGLGQLELRVRDPRLEATVVGQQQQPFAIAVEPPRRIDARHIDELRQRRARARTVHVGELAEDVVRFVEQDYPGHGGGLEALSIGFDRNSFPARGGGSARR